MKIINISLRFDKKITKCYHLYVIYKKGTGDIMFKKAVSLVLSLTLFASVYAPVCASASSYEETLRKKGFTDGYIDSLVALHKKYPNWEFEAFNTGLTWNEAINGERSTHSNQIIEKLSSYGNDYYCSCSKCKPNGKYRYQYGNCVCASRWAVEYFMDPRNWLDEKHIFQFQSNSYSKSDTKSGVEAILKPTWMHDSNITYKDGEGKEITFVTKKGNNLKYSKGIMLAAEKSGLSAYYIASRIVKEVGSSKPTAAGVCGTKQPFTGIYNYYSIGASSGAMSGLEWASGYLRSEEKTTLYSKYDSEKKKGTGTKTNVAKYQYMSYIGTYGDYFKVRLYSQSSYAVGLVGFVKQSALRTTYFTYNRPWTNPYKSILGGAKYIAEKYLTYQFTTYLEKFNVNKESGSLYSHEYMQNVDAVSTESVSTYNAYKNAGVLSSKHTFYIPVFKSMPKDTKKPEGRQEQTVSKTQVTNLKLKSRTCSKMTFKWSAVDGASKYFLVVRNLTKKTKFSKTVTSPTATIKGLTAGNKYKVRVKAYVGGSWREYSKWLTAKAIPMRGKITTLSSPSEGEIYSKWKKIKAATGYQLVYARDAEFKNIVATKNFNSTKLEYTGKNFTPGVTYYVRVRAYTKVKKKKHYGLWSKTKSIVSE